MTVSKTAVFTAGKDLTRMFAVEPNQRKKYGHYTSRLSQIYLSNPMYVGCFVIFDKFLGVFLRGEAACAFRLSSAFLTEIDREFPIGAGTRLRRYFTKHMGSVFFLFVETIYNERIRSKRRRACLRRE